MDNSRTKPTKRKLTTMEPLAACLAILTIWFTICKAFNNWEENK